jgi:hypothetical protein
LPLDLCVIRLLTLSLATLLAASPVRGIDLPQRHREATPNIGNLFRRTPRPTTPADLLARLRGYNASEREIARRGVTGREDVLAHWRKLSRLSTDLNRLRTANQLGGATIATKRALRKELAETLTAAVLPTEIFGSTLDERARRACDRRLQALLSMAIDAREALDLNIGRVLGVPVLPGGA